MKTLHPLLIVAYALMTVPAACSVSSDGLGNSHDSSAGGAPGTAWCPKGLTDQAGWPANLASNSCGQQCGPDSLGLQICRQAPLADCKKKPGCVCLVEPCVTCEDCGFFSVPDCYVPANATTVGACSQDISKGDACAPACSKQLCLRKDGKTACLCNEDGKYACGDWGASGWK
jgi:hypothetical protein